MIRAARSGSSNNRRQAMKTEAKTGRHTLYGRGFSLSAAFLFAAGTLMSGAVSAADNQKIIDLAKQEAKKGTFEIMVSSPKGERAQRAIMDAFQKRFDIKVDWNWTPLTSTVSARRGHQQATAGLPVPSAIGGYGYNTYDHWFVKNGLDAEVNWVEEFGEMFPRIKAAVID